MRRFQQRFAELPARSQGGTKPLFTVFPRMAASFRNQQLNGRGAKAP